MNVGKSELLKLLQEQNFYTPSKESCKVSVPSELGKSFEVLSNQKPKVSPSIFQKDSSLQSKNHHSNNHNDNMIVDTPRSLKKKILDEIEKNDQLEKTISVLPFLSSHQHFIQKTSYLQVTSSSSSSTESSILCENNHASNNGDFSPVSSEIKCYREKKIEEDLGKAEKKDDSLTGLIRLLKGVFMPSGENENVLEAASVGMTERICFDNEISERVIEAMSLNHSAALQMKTNNQTNVQFKTFETRMVKHDSEGRSKERSWKAAQKKHKISGLKNEKETESLRNEMNAKGDYDKKTKKEKHNSKKGSYRKIIHSKGKKKVKDSDKNSFSKLFSKSNHGKKTRLQTKKQRSKTKKKRKKSNLTTNERIHLLLDEILQQPNQDFFLEKLVKSLEMLHKSPPKPDTFITRQLSDSFNLQGPMLTRYSEARRVFVSDSSDYSSPLPPPRKAHNESYKISQKKTFLSMDQAKHETKQESPMQMPIELTKRSEKIKLEPDTSSDAIQKVKTQHTSAQLFSTQTPQPTSVQISQPASLQASQQTSFQTFQPSPTQSPNQTDQKPIDQNAIQLLISILSSSKVQFTPQSSILQNSDFTSMLLQTVLQLLNQQQTKQSKVLQNNSQQTINQTFDSLKSKESQNEQDSSKKQDSVEVKNQKTQVSQAISKACNVDSQTKMPETCSLNDAQKKISSKKHAQKDSKNQRTIKHRKKSPQRDCSNDTVKRKMSNNSEKPDPPENSVNKTPKKTSNHRNKESLKNFSSHNDFLSVPLSPVDTNSLTSESQDSPLKPPYVYPRKKPPASSQKSAPNHHSLQKSSPSLTEPSQTESNNMFIDAEVFEPSNFTDKLNLKNTLVSPNKPVLPAPSKEVINLIGVVLNPNRDTTTPEPKKTIVYNKVSRAETWSEIQVLKWLVLHNLKSCVKAFQKFKIDGKTLLSMNKEAIDEMQLGFWTSLKLQKNLKELRKLMNKEIKIRINGSNN